MEVAESYIAALEICKESFGIWLLLKARRTVESMG